MTTEFAEILDINVKCHNGIELTISIVCETKVKDIIDDILKFVDEHENPENIVLNDAKNETALEKEKTLKELNVENNQLLLLEYRKVNIKIQSVLWNNEKSYTFSIDAYDQELLQRVLNDIEFKEKGNPSSYFLKNKNKTSTITNKKLRNADVIEGDVLILIPNKTIKVAIINKYVELIRTKELRSKKSKLEKNIFLEEKRNQYREQGYHVCECGQHFKGSNCLWCDKAYVENKNLVKNNEYINEQKTLILNVEKQISGYKLADNDIINADLKSSTTGNDIINLIKVTHDFIKNSTFSKGELVYNDIPIQLDDDLYSLGILGNAVITYNYDQFVNFRTRSFMACRMVEPSYPIVEFWDWFSRSNLKVNPFVSMPNFELAELISKFCDEYKYGYNKREDIGRDLRQLKMANVYSDNNNRNKIDSFKEFLFKKRTPKMTILNSYYERYKKIKVHGVLLFLGVQKSAFNFIENNWKDLNHLTQDYLDIHYSEFDFKYKSDFEVLNSIRSLESHRVSLPCLILWDNEGGMSNAKSIPFNGFSEIQIFNSIQCVVNAIKEASGFDKLIKIAGKEIGRMVDNPKYRIADMGEKNMNSAFTDTNSNMIKVFISYSHRDEELMETFDTHLSMLKRNNFIDVWHDKKINPGDIWEDEISSELLNSDIIILLISPDFLASNYCYDIEVKKAIELHEEGSSIVIPILLRDCDWEDAPFAKIQGLPSNMKPIIGDSWNNIDEAFKNVISGIKKVIVT